MNSGLDHTHESRRLAGRVEGAQERRAREDAMKAIARDIPNPKIFAQYIPIVFVEALMSARVNRDGGQVSAHLACEMSRWGLVEVRGPHLTAFGFQVRKALIEGGH